MRPLWHPSSTRQRSLPPVRFGVPPAYPVLRAPDRSFLCLPPALDCLASIALRKLSGKPSSFGFGCFLDVFGFLGLATQRSYVESRLWWQLLRFVSTLGARSAWLVNA